MDAEITVKFIIRNACNQDDIDKTKGGTSQDKFENLIHKLIFEEGLMGIVEQPYQEIVKVVKV